MKISVCSYRLAFIILCLLAGVVRAEKPYQPEIPPRSDEGKQAIETFRLPEGTKLELVAAEPDMANPVAFCIDEQGRFFICESFRQKKGIEDNRGHMYWLMDDLKAETVEDRRRYMLKHHPEKKAEWTAEHDRLRLLIDSDQDGKVDESFVFADGFNDLVSGTGAGVLAFNGDIFYTNIPQLWKLSDENGDYAADSKEALYHGFGVRFAFRGHDMHGLTLGPDGRIYFSIGDRGYNVITADGEVLKRPDTGAVFRCERDGSQLEEFAYGLRNPQELAFDDLGNLFTGDNNSDSGDKARWVHVCEGSDSGWRMYFQYLSDRGPWNRERMWYPYQADEDTTKVQPAYIVPPVANLGDGPAGLVAYYGVGLPEKYEGHFFMADFRGQAANSGIRSFANKSVGASFELIDSQEYLWNTLVTDVDFGYDGALYYTDWVNGWDGVQKGRLYRSMQRNQNRVEAGQKIANIIAGGFHQLSVKDLVEHLGHADRRVRLRAQIELAERKETKVLTRVALHNSDQQKRIHALWGLWEAARKDQGHDVLKPIANLVADSQAEIVAQACRVLGDCRYQPGISAIQQALAHEDARVRYYAAQAAGKIASAETLPALVEMISAAGDEDPVLRHGGVMGLTGVAQQQLSEGGDLEQFLDYTDHSSRTVRLAVLLALRRVQHPAVADFLSDGDPDLVIEAARAIHDEPIPKALPELAKLTVKIDSPSLLRRVMSANFKLGGRKRAEAVVQMAATKSLDEELRVEALEELLAWENPPELDRVTNRYIGENKRQADYLKSVVQPYLGSLLNGSDELQSKTIELAGKLGIDDILPELNSILADETKPTSLRVAALQGMDRINPASASSAVEQMIESSIPELRTAARAILIKRKPEQAVSLLSAALEDGTTLEQQDAILRLGELKNESSQSVLVNWLTRLNQGSVPLALQLDLLNAAEQNKTPSITAAIERFNQSRDAADPLSKFEECLEGGNPGQGAEVFFGRAAASCRRCHVVNGDGGGVGPDLSEIAKKNDRRYLLESIVDPNAKIAKGFETVLLVTIEGKIISGIIKEETDEMMTLVKPMGEVVRIAQDDIDDRAPGKSGMPADLAQQLSKAEIRDLVAYLATLKEKKETSAHGEGEE